MGGGGEQIFCIYAQQMFVLLCFDHVWENKLERTSEKKKIGKKKVEENPKEKKCEYKMRERKIEKLWRELGRRAEILSAEGHIHGR